MAKTGVIPEKVGLLAPLPTVPPISKIIIFEHLNLIVPGP
jgi:hypothetical protein